MEYKSRSYLAALDVLKEGIILSVYKLDSPDVIKRHLWLGFQFLRSTDEYCEDEKSG